MLIELNIFNKDNFKLKIKKDKLSLYNLLNKYNKLNINKTLFNIYYYNITYEPYIYINKSITKYLKSAKSLDNTLFQWNFITPLTNPIWLIDILYKIIGYNQLKQKDILCICQNLNTFECP